MPFQFSEICTLFSRLEDIEFHEPPILATAERTARNRAVTESWFKSHRHAIDKLSVPDGVALLSALLPERRCDRVYGIQSATLCRILSRCLGLSAARAKDLQSYKQHRGGDLGNCLARVLAAGGPPANPPVTLDEVDGMLNTLASACRFSGPNVTFSTELTESRDELIGNIVKRLDPIQGKWLVRLILKDLSASPLHEALVLQCVHFLLPDLLRFQNTFEAALRLLKGPLRDFPSQPDPRSQRLHRESAALLLEPAVGVKVGRPTFIKGRSIDSCIKLCGQRKWILERKYDGEYCEIHIDMSRSSNPSECLTIFSKSGKDSTEDRKAIHQILIDCFHLDRPKRKIKRRAIILGELVVYSDSRAEILPFEKIRQHVSRSGIFLGTDEDSPPDQSEHLAIVFFDLLLLDDEIIMKKPLHERRQRLRQVYTKLPGRATGAEWKIVDFQDAAKAKKTLIQQFAASIAQRCEGLVLKPCCEPYFSLNRDASDYGYTKAYIKLKKDYIAGMGDEADLAVVGGSYDGQDALKCDIQHLKWTTFYLACLTNKPDVLRLDARPRFKVVATLHAQHCIPRPVLDGANVLGTLSAKPYVRGPSSENFDIECVPSNMETVFTEPMVFEVLGSGFEKPSNSSFLMLRHPRVKKLHQDRTWKDCVSLDELQQQAIAARNAPPEGESQETLKLIEKLEAKCQKKSRLSATPGSKGLTTPPTVGRSGQSPIVQLTNRRVYHTESSDSLDGTTLIDSTPNRPKRLRDSSNDVGRSSETKRRRVEDRPPRLKKREKLPAKPDGTPNALLDITNTASTRVSDRHGQHSTGKQDGSAKCHLGHETSSTSKPLCRSPRSPVSHKAQRERKCATDSCFLAEAVIYASSCIASTPYIMRDLLPCHNITLAASLAHWDRDSFSSPPGTDTVSESQAYERMRKIVFVERMRQSAVSEMVKSITGLNGGLWRERVEFWDWRVLETEDCRWHSNDNSNSSRHFLGATDYDMMKGRTIFISAQSSGSDVQEISI